jgi:putative FmdB family regulatory protein
MPIYEYRCSACGHHLEALQKMTEAPLRKCPDCGKQRLKRLVSASQFRLKGSGWYETDFKNKNETKRNLVEKAGAESSEAASDKSTDTAAKDEAGKAVAAAKGGDATAKPPQAKPVKPAAAARKPAAKSRAKAARG